MEKQIREFLVKRGCYASWYQDELVKIIREWEQSRQAAVSGLLPLPSSQDIQDAADDAYPDLGECRRNEFGIDEFVLKRTAFVRGARYVIIKASGGNDR